MSQLELRKRFWTKAIRAIRTTTKSTKPASLKIEHLEDRSVPASLAFSGPVEFGNSTTTGVMVGDLTGDGRNDTVIASGADFQIVDGASGSKLTSFRAFDASAKGTLWFAVANTTGDLRADVNIKAVVNGVTVDKVYDGAGTTQSGSSGAGKIKKLPAAKFSNGGSVAEAGTATVAFSQVSDPLGRGVKYSYDFNNDGTFEVSGSSSASVAVPAGVTADGPKTATVRGRVTDASGRTADYITAFQVTSVAPTPAAGVPGTATVGQTGAFTASATDPSPADRAAGFAFAWNFGDGTIGTGADATHTYAAPGTYTVTLTATDKDGAARSVTRTTMVQNVTTPPVVPPTTPPVVPPTTPPVVPPTAPPTTPPTVPPVSPPVVPPPPPAAPPSATFGNGGSVGEGGSATVAFSQVSDPLGRGLTYSYDFNNDGTYEVVGSSSASVAVPAGVTADGPKAATVRGRVTDADGRTADYSTAFQITSVAPTPTAGVPDAVKLGQSAAFSASATDSSSADTAAGFAFAWNFGDGTNGTGASPSHTYAAPGTYTVTLTATDKDGASRSVTRTTTIVDLSNSDSGVVVTPDYIITQFDKIPNFGKNPTLVAVQSGNWSDPATWGGRLPATDDVISIGNGVTINYDQVSDVKVTTVAIQFGGTLNFRTFASTRLRVTNLLVMEGGTLTVGTTADPVAAGVKAEIIINDVAIDTSKDPSQYGNGLIVLGKVSMHGAVQNETFIRLASEPLAGDTTLRLSAPVTGWKAGDRLLLADTRQKNDSINELERPTIASVSPDGLSVVLTQPLAFSHYGARDVDGNMTFLPHVGNMTRNVVVKSESATGTRGHTFFTARAEVDLAYSQFSGLGRTRNDHWDTTKYDASGTVTSLATNQMERYAVNFHHLIGPTASANGYQFRFEGNAVSCPIEPMPFRWGIAVNDSHYGLIKDNVLYNWAGAGIVTVQGNETGNVIESNFITRTTGDGGRGDAGFFLATADFATEGTGIWLAGGNNFVRDNVVANATKYGYNLTARSGTLLAPAFPGADANKAGQGVEIRPQQTAIEEFARNEIYGKTITGMTIWTLGAGYVEQYEIGQSVIKDFRVWNIIEQGFYFYPVNNLVIDGYVARNGWNQFGIGIWFSDYHSPNVVIRNADIQGFTHGIQVPDKVGDTFAIGDTVQPTVIENSYLRNKEVNIAVRTMNGVTGGGISLSKRKTIVRDVLFGPVTGAINISMGAWLNNENAPNFVRSDELFVYNYNRVQGDNFQVFYNEQVASFVLPQTGLRGGLVGSPEAGLTNAESMARYGVAFAGSVAPESAVAKAGIHGLIAPISN